MIQRIKKYFRETFSSLAIRNFRLYFFGQGFSMIGTFMQIMAQSWLVLEITHSGTALGFTMTLQYLPMFVLGPIGGMIVDQSSRRKILLLTKTIYAILALALGIIVLLGIVQLWMILFLAFCIGIINIFDGPASYAFMSEMVFAEKLKNAVTLHTAMVNLSRVVGPVIGALLITKVGIASCFIFNGVSFLAVIAMILMMDIDGLQYFEPVKKAKGQMLEGFRYVFSKPELASTVVMIALIGTLTYEFPVSLAMLAKDTFGGDADSYAYLTAAFGLGAAFGGFIHASRKMGDGFVLVFAAFAFGVSVVMASIMPNLYLAIFAMAIVGIFSIWFSTMAGTTLQLGSTPQLRGRVMVIWSMFYMGSTAIGGPIIGWVGQAAGPRWALALGGIVAIIAAGLGFLVLKKSSLSLQTSEVIVE